MTTARHDALPNPFGFDADSPEDQAILDDADTEYGLLVALIKARARLELTQRDIADRLGVSQSVISDMERGKTELKLTTALEYARAVQQELTIRLDNRDVRHALPARNNQRSTRGTTGGTVTKLANHRTWSWAPSHQLPTPHFGAPRLAAR